MLEDVEENRSLMMRMKSTREMTEPVQIRGEAVDSNEIDLQYINHLMRVWWRPNIGRLARRTWCHARSKALEILSHTREEVNVNRPIRRKGESSSKTLGDRIVSPGISAMF